MRVADIFNYSAVFGSVGVLVVKDVSVKRGCRLVARAGERARARMCLRTLSLAIAMCFVVACMSSDFVEEFISNVQPEHECATSLSSVAMLRF